jgi:hypothetical protein
MGVKERSPFAVNVVSLRGVPIVILESISARSSAFREGTVVVVVHRARPSPPTATVPGA